MLRARDVRRIWRSWELVAVGLVALSLQAACRRSTAPGVDVPGALRGVTFSGMCDASGAVPLSNRLFAVADDEGNTLRIYDADRGGVAVSSFDVSPHLNLPEKRRKKRAAKKAARSREVDIEAATRVGDHAYWLTSHAHAPSGKPKPERHRFFATTLPRDGVSLEMVGAAYESLVHDLGAHPPLARFGLAHAADLGPRDPGGLNIEGMTERLEGGVFIGFRNPVPAGKALVVVLLNPEQVVLGVAPRFGDVFELDLGGLGVRGLSSWRGRYLVAAGHYDQGSPSRLYTWHGKDEVRVLENLDFTRFNPEGFFTPEERDEILLLSDDGGLSVDGQDCKKLRSGAAKRFRGVWVSLLPRAHG